MGEREAKNADVLDEYPLDYFADGFWTCQEGNFGSDLVFEFMKLIHNALTLGFSI